MTRAGWTAGAAAVLLCAACGEIGLGVGSGPVDGEADLAAVAAAGLAWQMAVTQLVQEVATTSRPLGPAQGESRGTSPMPPVSGCRTGVEPGRWTCNVQVGGVTGQVSVGFRDGAGQPTLAYDSLTTERILLGTQISGTAQAQRGDVAFAQAAEAVLSGLTGREARRTWNGSGNTALQVAFSDRARPRAYSLSGTLTARDVLLPVPRVAGQGPESGTLTFTLSGTQTVDGRTRTFAGTAVFTFDGSPYAGVAVGSERFRLNLADGTMQRV